VTDFNIVENQVCDSYMVPEITNHYVIQNIENITLSSFKVTSKESLIKEQADNAINSFSMNEKYGDLLNI
jgi:hypothetical protein